MTDKPHDTASPTGKGPPEKAYQIQIDKDHYAVTTPQMTGRSLLELAGKAPAEAFAIYLKPKGPGQPQRIGLDQALDLNIPGTERFVTLPLDQTEGREADRREFDLPSEDAEWLEATGQRYEFVREGGVLRVVLYGCPVPPGYNVTAVDVNVRIEPGYPDTQIDMAYFHPPLARTDGRAIGATCSESFDGKNWQRWSRHRTPLNPWRPGIDSLATHFALIEHWLRHELTKA